MALSDIPGITPEYAATLAENGITTLEQLRDADPIGVAALFDWVSGWTAGQWAAHARTSLEDAAKAAGTPSPEKWFVALQPLSVEGVIPNYEVAAGELVNLWFRSDDHIERLIQEKVVARIDDQVHTLAKAPFLPVPAIRRLAQTGIFTVEAMLSGEVAHVERRIDVKRWLGSVAPTDTVEKWLQAARDYLAGKETALIAVPTPAQEDTTISVMNELLAND